jgi:hypothetical protein
MAVVTMVHGPWQCRACCMSLPRTHKIKVTIFHGKICTFSVPLRAFLLFYYFCCCGELEHVHVCQKGANQPMQILIQRPQRLCVSPSAVGGRRKVRYVGRRVGHQASKAACMHASSIQQAAIDGGSCGAGPCHRDVRLPPQQNHGRSVPCFARCNAPIAGSSAIAPTAYASATISAASVPRSGPALSSSTRVPSIGCLLAASLPFPSMAARACMHPAI